MYIPKVFEIQSRDECFQLIEEWSFGDLVTCYGGELQINHLPFLLDKEQGILLTHMANQNPQLSVLEDADDLRVVFKGANAYVSPGWYVSDNMVPTWNYEAVQVKGKAQLLNQNALMDILVQLSAKHEQDFDPQWKINKVSDRNLSAMMKAITGIAISIDAIEGKSKLSQNRSPQDREGVIDGLFRQKGEMQDLIAQKMRQKAY